MINIILDHIDTFCSSRLARPRRITIYRPDVTEGAFDTLYVNDGQDLEEMGLVALLERRADPRLMVVGIDATEDRLQEYGTAHTANDRGLGAQAGAYRDFVVQELLPHIDALYPTRREPQGRAICGWSLGGLSAFDIAWHYPHLFGAVGVFSGSFWWHTPAATPAEVQAARITHKMVRDTLTPPKLRFWFEAGTDDETDDRDGNGVIDAIQDTTELMDELALKGYRPGIDMVYRQVEGGRHHQSTWAAVFPEFLDWWRQHDD